MKSFLFVFLFIGVGIAVPDSHLLDLKHSSILSSVGGLVDSVPTLLNNPVDGIEGLVTVAPLALSYGLSSLRLSKSIDNLTAFIRKSTDTSLTVTQYIGSISNGLDDLIPAALCFDRVVREATDKYHNLNLFKVKSITDCLSKTTKAQYDISAAIQARLNGIPAESSTDLDDLTGKIDRASQAMQGFADVADNVHGVTGFFFGIAAHILLVDYGLIKLSASLHMLANAISDSSDTSFDELVRALHGLAQTEKNINVAFQHLAYLT
ncbi:uncharacterized protein LOC119071773 isoform X3 [Bradysia coprophila]|uniref:uncharacterized protein LOC119071773 isoform X3 n=1 Tax=Bradysia coprophila TaxID=38358 RepID=UPI00187DDA46|nr:uncharacterized protein LOC119071773 isoform X3 [Bradysia coprophila]